MGFFDELFGTTPQKQEKKKYPPWACNTDMFKDQHYPEFVDFRDKWGSNNDHNWEADGDMRWDSYE